MRSAILANACTGFKRGTFAYSSGNFHVTAGVGGTVKINDPRVVNGGSVAPAVPEIAFGARTTLAYLENSFVAWNSPGMTDGRHAATNFTTTAGGQGGTLISGTTPAEQQSLLTHPPWGGPRLGALGRSRQRWQRPRDCPCHRCTAHTRLAATRVWPYSAPRAVHVCRTVPGTIFAPLRENRGTERMREHRERDRGDCLLGQPGGDVERFVWRLRGARPLHQQRRRLSGRQRVTSSRDRRHSLAWRGPMLHLIGGQLRAGAGRCR
jgi:hypothetical protein